MKKFILVTLFTLTSLLSYSQNKVVHHIFLYEEDFTEDTLTVPSGKYWAVNDINETSTLHLGGLKIHKNSNGGVSISSGEDRMFISFPIMLRTGQEIYLTSITKAEISISEFEGPK